MMPAAPMSAAAATASKAGSAVGEQHEDEAHAARHGAKRFEAGLRVAAGKQPELDIVDTASRALEHRVADRFGLHRQIADGGADRHAAGDQGHDGPRGFAVDRAKRALRRLFQVDDVGAGEKRDLGFGLVAHAGKKEGHLCC